MAPGEHLGWPFLRLGSTLGGLRNHPGGPWEHQDGPEFANNKSLVDFGVISGFLHVSIWSSKCIKSRFIFSLLSGHIFIDF